MAATFLESSFAMIFQEHAWLKFFHCGFVRKIICLSEMYSFPD